MKQLVLNQIDKKLKDLRTLKQHYYPEGGWGWVVLAVALAVQALAHGAQLGLAGYLAGLGWEPTHQPSAGLGGSPYVPVRSYSLRAALILGRRIVAGSETDASKTFFILC